jgi:D-cysteine desulfhydrase
MKIPERLHLATTPTPIQRLYGLSKRLGKSIWVLRDDLTGFLESGNKIRKLEFILHDALRAKATRVLTCGGPQSNHARATVVLARRLGLEVSVLVREPRQGFSDTERTTGNYLINQMFGADITSIPFATYEKAGSSYQSFLTQEWSRLKDLGERVYIIPEGGSCPLGSFGYFRAVHEMNSAFSRVNPDSKPHPDSVFLALGSGGTLAGLVLGLAEVNLPTEIVHAINVCDSKAYFEERVGKLILETCDEFQLKHPKAPLNIHDGYFGEGYGLASDEDLKSYIDLAREDGILLDPVYTGKAMGGMVAELSKNGRNYGEDILFIHTGGGLANFAFASRYRSLVG